MAGDIHLGMGDDISFKGFGLDLKLTGDMMLEQAVDRPLLALGELSIPTGTYSLYGQQLSINDGKLIFLGNPMNPALDLQATRRTPKAEVGVLMNGTVSHINAQLFSTPSLPESEILSLLITGNSFSDLSNGNTQDSQNMLGAIALLGLEKGQGLTSSISSELGLDTVAISSGNDYRDSALGLGKYINPNLFMRYDIGLFDRENVLTLDYILTDRIKLEVETGVSQSVDLTYTVEK
jgi:translocation and assembly module TamB